MERAANGNIGETKRKDMKEKEKGRTIDLGTGAGGAYLGNMNSDVVYCCVDRNIDDLRIVKKRNSYISAVGALAEHLPFREKVFDEAVILFPGGSILSPGLQSHVPFPPEMKHESVERSGTNLYEDLAKILKPKGQLYIYGDWMLLADEIISEKKYEPFFKFVEKKALEDEDFLSLGTSASNQAILRRGKNLESPANRIIFQKRGVIEGRLKM